ncbi:hypothetical protein ACJROX_01295 [Pseudalkalibacillus sp. A8]|uniref:hypothetical protein n=1 Tax=Pseudalkalibacillus sp. A8 TaxID=3382641 RepID=UPI0038B427C9
MVRHIKRKRTIYLPAFLLILLIGLLTFHHATKERDLTPNGFSRNTEVADGAKGKVLTAKKVGDGYDIHFNENGKLTNLQVNENLEVTNKESLPVQLDLNASIWANQGQAYYLEDQELVYFDGEDKQTVDNKIEGFKASTENLYYWKDDRVYMIDPTNNSSRQLLQTSAPVTKLFVSEQKGLFAVINKKEQYTTEVSVYKTNKGDAQKIEEFDIDSISGENVKNIDIAENEDGIHLIYQTAQPYEGTIIVRGHYNLFSTPHEQPSFEEIKVYDTFTKSRQRVIENLDLVMTERGPELFLSIRSMIKPKIESWNVYRAIQKDGKWIANHISTSTSVSKNHVYVDEGEIFWLDTRGKDSKIIAVSDNPFLIEKAETFQVSDWVNGFYSGIAKLPYGLILLLVAVMWLAPTLIFLFCVTFWNEDAIEQRRSWVRYSAIGLFTIFQYFLLQRFFTPVFEAYSPIYLSFQMYSIIVPIVLVLLSWFFTHLVRKNHWNFYQEFGYFALFHTLMIIFLISPYTI